MSLLILKKCKNAQLYSTFFSFSQKVFIDYREGKLNFPPTYKFDPGTDNWDSSDKARAPAWTDRVLWKGQHITQTSYKSVLLRFVLFV